MNSGNILLFKAEKDLLSKIIAWGTNSKYSHIALCVSPTINLAIEAMTRGGVRARDIRKIDVGYEVYRVKSEFTFDLDKMISYLVDRLNERYDYKGVIWLGVLKLLQKTGLRIKNHTNNFQKN